MDADIPTVARRIVRDSLDLQETDALRVQASEHTLPLGKEIVKEARRRGADTMLTLDADDIWYDAMLNLPEDWLRGPSELVRALHGTVTAIVYVGGIRDPGPMEDISGERWRANAEGSRTTGEPWDDDPVPYLYVALGNVTEPRAARYGYDYGAWRESVLAAMAVPPEKLAARGEAVAAVLQGAREARLRAPGGTDFRFAFHDTGPTVWTGKLAPEEGRRSTYYQSLPEGSVGVALRQGSGEGTVAATAPVPYAGDRIHGLTWAFEDGRVVDVSAEKNLDLFRMRWDEKRGEGADQLGALIVGTNPAARFGFLNNAIVEGAVTVVLGDNEDFDGTNGCGFAFPLSFADGTLEVDGKTLVADGILRV